MHHTTHHATHRTTRAGAGSGAGRPAGISIPRLRNAFDGEVIAPGDPGYDQARTVFQGGIDRRPAVIIRPADAVEVARVVTLARDSGLELADAEHHPDLFWAIRGG